MSARGGGIAGCLTSMAGLLVAEAARADWALNLPRGVTPFSNEVYQLHMLILGICCVIGAGVYGVIFYSIFKFRKSKGAVPANFHHNTKAEFIWTMLPLLILIGMAIPATRSLMNMENVADPALTIKVTGYQWKWGYEYVGEDVSLFSTITEDSNSARLLRSGVDLSQIENYLLDVDNYLVIPINTKIRVLTTAADVIHAWWVPEFGWKRDAIPGFINESWLVVQEPGIYRGQCTELCGKDHGFMPIVVEAVSPEAFDDWLQERKPPESLSVAGDL